MDNGWIFIIVVIGLIMVLNEIFKAMRRKRRKNQLEFIKNYPFHQSIIKKVRQQYPHLSLQETKSVFEALRTYFYICHAAEGKRVAMPSLVVDTAWHEFILFTRLYAKFCNKAAEDFIHHTPTSATSSSPTQEGIQRAWKLSCEQDNMNPKEADHLPVLFNIDAQLKIEKGYQYTLDYQQGNNIHNGLYVPKLGALRTIGFSTGWEKLGSARNKSSASGIGVSYVYYVECDGSSLGDGSSSSSDSDSGGSSCGSSCGGGD
jgi:hypothetical protein